MKNLNYETWAYGGRKVQYFRFANSVEPGVNRRRLLDLRYYHRIMNPAQIKVLVLDKNTLEIKLKCAC